MDRKIKIIKHNPKQKQSCLYESYLRELERPLCVPALINIASFKPLKMENQINNIMNSADLQIFVDLSPNKN